MGLESPLWLSREQYQLFVATMTQTKLTKVHGVEGKLAALLERRKGMFNNRKPKLGRSLVTCTTKDENTGVRKGEESFFQQFAILQRSIGPGKMRPEVRNFIRLEFYLNVCEASSLDVFEDRCGGANSFGERLDMGATWPEYKCQRGQPREPWAYRLFQPF